MIGSVIYTQIFIILNFFQKIFVLNVFVVENSKENKECFYRNLYFKKGEMMEICQGWGQVLVEERAWRWKGCFSLSMFRVYMGLKIMGFEGYQFLRWRDFFYWFLVVQGNEREGEGNGDFFQSKRYIFVVIGRCLYLIVCFRRYWLRCFVLYGVELGLSRELEMDKNKLFLFFGFRDGEYFFC